MLDHQEGGGHLALLGDDAHAAAGGVVRNDLKTRSKIMRRASHYIPAAILRLFASYKEFIGVCSF